MKVNSILDVFGGIILLAALATVAAKPQFIGTIGSSFTGNNEG